MRSYLLVSRKDLYFLFLPIWRFVVAAYPMEKWREFMYVCMYCTYFHLQTWEWVIGCQVSKFYVPSVVAEPNENGDKSWIAS